MSDDKPKEQINGENDLSTGNFSVPAGTFEHDLAINSGYQNFSAELLRLSLAGIGVIGFLVTNIFLINKNSAADTQTRDCLFQKTNFAAFVFASLIFFGFSALFAMAHRYYATDSQAYHLNYVRLERRNLIATEKEDGIKKAEKQKKKRNKLLKFSAWLLIISAGCLWLGAMSLIFSFTSIIFPKS